MLEESAGTDGTEPFEYAGHSTEALNTLDRLQVGVLDGHGTSPGANSSTTAAPLPLGKIGLVTGRRRAWSLALWGSLLSLLPLIVLVRLFWRAADSKPPTAPLDETVLQPVIAFVIGLVLASSLSFAGLVAAYSRLKDTLTQDKDVFGYPSVIPARR